MEKSLLVATAFNSGRIRHNSAFVVSTYDPAEVGTCCTDQPFPSGSPKNTNRPPGEVLDLAHDDPMPDQLGPGDLDVRHHQLQPLDRARLSVDNPGAKGDRTGRSRGGSAARSELRRSPGDRGRVEADLVDIEGLRPVHIGRGNTHQVEFPVHRVSRFLPIPAPVTTTGPTCIFHA